MSAIEALDGKAPVLVADHLAKRYLGAVPVDALVDATFSLSAAEFVAVVGRSGSGKSTLLTLLGLLDEPTAGRLLIDGAEATGLSGPRRDALRSSRIGFVFQSFHLVREMTAQENVTLALRYCGVPRRERGTASAAALERVGLSHRAAARVSTLSGGEQQRLAIARALAKSPAIVLADEPTGNLDSDNEAIVLDIFRDLAAAGTALLVVTHSLELAGHADRVLRMNDGRIGRVGA